MGFFSNMKSAFSGAPDSAPGGSNSAAYGNHSIQASAVLTSAGGPSPTNPGSFGNIRTVNGPDAPTYFTPEQAEQMQQQLKEKRQAASATRSAYRALAQMESCDVMVQEAHYGYQTVAAQAELMKQRAKLKYAKALHSQRSSYAAMSHGLELADRGAQERIAATQQRMNAAFDETMNKLRNRETAGAGR